MIKLTDIYFRVIFEDGTASYTLCYTSSPHHAVKEDLKNGYLVDQLKVIPMIAYGK